MIGARQATTRHAAFSLRRQAGFTLMELLVVLALFSTLVTAASDILMLASRAQRKSINLEKTQADARYTMEAIAHEVRTGMIDYSWYESSGNALVPGMPTLTLALISENGDKMRFYIEHDASQCGEASNTPCIMVSVNDTSYAAITPKGVTVKYARFYLTPTVDPFKIDPATGLYAANEQPQVTVAMVLSSTGIDVAQQALVHLQTTVVSRVYRR